MAISGDMIPKTFYFNLGLTGGKTSDCVFEQLFELNYFETFERTNIKPLSSGCHKGFDGIMMITQSKIIFRNRIS